VLKATGNLAKITTQDDNNGATNPLHIGYNASLRVDNAYSGAAPSANGTKVAKIQMGTVTANGYGAYGAIILDAQSNGYDSAEMSFATGSNSSSLMTERMRIDSAGQVGIGATNPDALLHLKGGNEVAKIKFEVGTADADKFKIYASTAGRLYVNSYSGNTGVYLTYNGTSWTSNSDETLKDNITSLGTVGDKLKNYRTSYFNWKADTDTPPKRNIGFIAQDWETDFPEVVTKKEGETLGMQYTETIPILLKYIQELEARITALEA
jgi:hypothetical protein